MSGSPPERSLAGEALEAAPAALALAALGALLRFFQLGEPELWLDEINMLAAASAQDYSVVSWTHHAHVIPAGWMLGLFGDNAVGLRILGALQSTLAVAAMVIAVRWVADRRTALAAGTLVAINPYLVGYAQDGNYYSGMFLYAVLQWCALAAFLRGAVLPGAAAFTLVSYAAHFNQPFGSINTAGLLLAATIQIFANPAVRARFAAVFLRARVLVPAAIFLAVMVFLSHRAIRTDLYYKFTGIIEVQGDGLTNISLSPGFFFGILADWSFGIFRRLPVGDWLALIPTGFACAGVGLLLADEKAPPERRSLAWLALSLPIFSFVFIFNLPLERTFYNRYLAYMLPYFLLGAAVAAAWAAERLERRLGRLALPATLAPVAALQLPFLLSYFAADLRNFDRLVPLLAEKYRQGEPVFVVDQMDRTRVERKLPAAGLPAFGGPNVVAPVYRMDLAPAIESAFLHTLAGAEPFWVVNSWQQLPLPEFYARFDEWLETVYAGVSAQGRYQDARLQRWTADKSVPLPYAANGALPPAEPWPFTIEPHRMASFPDHTRMRVDDGAIFRERDGALEYLVTIPEGVGGISIAGALEWLGSDAPDPAQRLFAELSVDGRHSQLAELSTAEGSAKTYAFPLRIEPGTHRLRIGVYAPRDGKEELSRWKMGSVSVGPAAPTGKPAAPRLVEFPPERIEWHLTATPEAKNPGWVALEKGMEIRMLADAAGPTGAPVVEVQVPADRAARLTLLSPPVPVGDAEYLLAAANLRVEGVPLHEATLCHVFFGADRKPIPAPLYSTEPMATGSMFPGHWRRIVDLAPVPAGAASVCVGVAVLPRKVAGTPREGRILVEQFEAPRPAASPTPP
ncbi:MAG: hypothetical protein SF028_11440 [Candidatus Sumerlaeia bacterium]|nr:hypothetical protein [Candidatus Sumerlaeia bacterium]